MRTEFRQPGEIFAGPGKPVDINPASLHLSISHGDFGWEGALGTLPPEW